ncbi:MAG: hypothetical protein EAX96_05285 [Candidatus Lokiarchaeota archaeon]|nr:hypothetical protein [Candidatus Lokiarchaeota archaeon]
MCREGNLLLHLGFIGVLALTIWKKKYGFRWLVPDFLEVALVFTLSFVTIDLYVPALTIFIGSLISGTCILYIRGYEKNRETEKPVEKILSAFIYFF